MKKFLSLYIHIPFCAVKCKYCDFLSYDGESYGTMLRYVDCLCQEIKLYAPIADEYIVRSIFIGGGTPSLLDESLIVNIMAFIKKTFTLEKNVEVTIEANPGTLRHQKLNGYKQAGINRISIGLQSADDSMLKRLGRLHNYDQFVASYKAARRAGFDNINIDVMSGLPGQSIHSYVDTLSKVIDYGPEHISAYSLSIEEGTPFANDPSILESLPPEMIERRMYEITKKLLSVNGYERYEISNYAKPGYECRHNMVYWTGGEYVGFGLGASSYFQGKRFSNLRDIFKYLNLMEDLSDRFVETDNLETLYNETTRILRENVTPIYIDSRMEEFMFLGLRMIQGIERSRFYQLFGFTVDNIYSRVISQLEADELLLQNPERVWLTEKGLDLSNYALAQFLLD